MIDKGTASALGFFLDDFTSLTFCANEQDTTLVCSKLTHIFQCIFKHGQGFFQIDDMDLVTVTEDERCHFWIPITGLMAEVNPGFQHLTHSYGHNSLQ